MTIKIIAFIIAAIITLNMAFAGEYYAPYEDPYARGDSTTCNYYPDTHGCHTVDCPNNLEEDCDPGTASSQPSQAACYTHCASVNDSAELVNPKPPEVVDPEPMVAKYWGEDVLEDEPSTHCTYNHESHGCNATTCDTSEDCESIGSTQPDFKNCIAHCASTTDSAAVRAELRGVYVPRR